MRDRTSSHLKNRRIWCFLSFVFSTLRLAASSDQNTRSSRGLFCGGSTDLGQTKWQAFGSAGLSVKVDTSGCHLSGSPRYLSSVIGNSKNWQLTGTNCIYDLTHDSFKIYVYHPSMRKLELLKHAKQFWKVSWVADTGKQSGDTSQSVQSSVWSQFGSHSLYMDVDTRVANFKSIPVYGAALNGFHSHWRSIGMHSLYKPTATGFRVYILYELSEITPDDASKWKWSISWIGSRKSYSGLSDTGWKSFKAGGSDVAVHLRVNTSLSNFQHTPAYVASLLIDSPHQWLIGGANIYNPTHQSFRVYLDRVSDISALTSSWRVGYFGYEADQDCSVGPWSSWGLCSKTCGGGSKVAHRAVLQQAYGSGEACPSLIRNKTCHSQPCPQLCQLSQWIPWSQCSQKCGVGEQERTRSVLVQARYGAPPCPHIRETRTCNQMPCAGTGETTESYCGGTTPKQSKWVINDETGIQLKVDTGACNYQKSKSTDVFEASRNSPYYVASVITHDGHFTASSTIFNPSHSGFSLAVWNPDIEARKLWFYATRYRWRVSWLADTSRRCGRTPQGHTAWQSHERNRSSEVVPAGGPGADFDTLYIDVNTVQSNFTGTPVYILAFVSVIKPVYAAGVHNLLHPTSLGFRSYIQFYRPALGLSEDESVGPKYANDQSWTVTWFSAPAMWSGDSSDSANSWNQPGVAADSSLHVRSSLVAGQPDGVVPFSTIDVDTSAFRFPRVPHYVTSVVYPGSESMFRYNTNVFGAGSISDPSETGFKLALFEDGTTNLPSLRQYNPQKWRVNYAAQSPPVDCRTSLWGPYSACSKSCESGVRTRNRTVLTNSFGGGMACPSLLQSMECNAEKCPIDCSVSEWTEWAVCSATCGGGSTLRKRAVLVAPEYGGQACPTLKQAKACSNAKCPVDCKVSGWTAWSKCDKKCGIDGKKRRARKVTTYPQSGGMSCPILEDTTPCNNLPCVGQGSGRICGAQTSASPSVGSGVIWHKWKSFGSQGIYMDVDTSSCSFESTPNYMTTLVGDAAHWQLSGTNSVFKASKASFRIYLWHPNIYSENLLSAACKYAWTINWIADTGPQSGRTTEGHTGWMQLDENTIYADVDTINSRNPVTPRYFTAIYGKQNHWRITGAHSIYNPESDGFRVYLSFPDISPSLAESYGWSVAWIGSFDDAASGESGDWEEYHDPQGAVTALFINVDASVHKFHGNPIYITSVSGQSHHWGVSGGSSIYSPNKGGFRLYLDEAESVYFAQKKKWHVNYLVYQGAMDCVLTPWSTWSPCPETNTCTQGAQQKRLRSVINPAYNGGRCWMLKQTRLCRQVGCPVDCKVSKWSSWSTCSHSCGAQGLQSRNRNVTTKMQFEGKGCPSLLESKRCVPAPKPCPQLDFSRTGRKPCKERTEYGLWSTCTADCGPGFKYRYRIHVLCDKMKRAVPFKMKIKQKLPCAIRACNAVESPNVHSVTIPELATSLRTDQTHLPTANPRLAESPNDTHPV